LQWREREAAVSVWSNFKRVGFDKRVTLFYSSFPSQHNPGTAINCFIPLATIIRCPKGKLGLSDQHYTYVNNNLKLVAMATSGNGI
jgi:hypothetical protein